MLLVVVKVVKVKGMVGQTNPEHLVNHDLELIPLTRITLNLVGGLQKDNVAEIKLTTLIEDRGLDVLLSNLWACITQTDKWGEILLNSNLESTGQVPGLTDPKVAVVMLLVPEVMPNKGCQLCGQVISGRAPGDGTVGRLDEGCQVLLEGHTRLVLELVDRLALGQLIKLLEILAEPEQVGLIFRVDQFHVGQLAVGGDPLCGRVQAQLAVAGLEWGGSPSKRLGEGLIEWLHLVILQLIRLYKIRDISDCK